jgi:hypothetical protein
LISPTSLVRTKETITAMSVVGSSWNPAISVTTRRARDPEDGRVVRLRVTRARSARLARLSRRHLQELERLQTGTMVAR